MQTIDKDTERKTVAILKVLSESSEPLGSIAISRELERHGVFLSERAVRYHLRMTDERGYTEPMGRDGRIITTEGLEELRLALAPEQVGFIIEKLQLLAFHTTFDPVRKTGLVPINTSIFQAREFSDALHEMRAAFDAGLCASRLVAVAHEGEKIGTRVVPRGKVALATVCGVVINGVLLKSSVPIESRFGGVLELRNGKPRRFVAIIKYDGTSLDPSEQYIRARMTAVRDAAASGTGRILANFREILAPSRVVVEKRIEELKAAGMNAVYLLGNTSESICQIEVGMNRVGMVLLGGLNPVAAAAEAGIDVENAAESGLIDYSRLVDIDRI
jgi:HTH-type transcriptional regulator, global nitrogen regulator NrpRI